MDCRSTYAREKILWAQDFLYGYMTQLTLDISCKILIKLIWQFLH